MRRIVVDLIIFLGGVATAVAFIVSCGSGKNGSSAPIGVPPVAAQAGCAQYEVTSVQVNIPDFGTPARLPAGWVPFEMMSTLGTSSIHVFRCAQ